MNVLRSTLSLALLCLLFSTLAYGQTPPPEYFRWIHGFVESEPSYTWRGHLAVTDQFGDIHTVTGRGPYVEYSRWSPDTGWTKDYISEDGPFHDVALTVDDNGHVYIAYVSEDEQQLFIAETHTQGYWISQVVYEHPSGYFGSIEMALDNQGLPAIAAEYFVPSQIVPSTSAILYFGQAVGAGWVGEVIDQDNVWYLGAMVMDANGMACVVYQDYGQSQLMYAQRLAANQWQATEIYQVQTTRPADLLLDNQGLPEFLMSDGPNLHHLTWGGNFWNSQILFSVPGPFQTVDQPQWVRDPDGDIQASFLLRGDTDGTLYHGDPADTDSWKVIDKQVSTNALTLDDAGNPVLIYQMADAIKAAWLQPWPELLVGVFPRTVGTGSPDRLVSGDSSPPQFIYGGPGTLEGKFQTPGGTPDAQGWTSVDVSDTPVGAFGKVWNGGGEYDPVYGVPVNTSPRWAFIDDGLVVPGTGGSYCQEWCYGARGYVVNSTGGLSGPGNYLRNEIWSPVIPWNPGRDGGILEFDAYLHDKLAGNSPGFALTWSVRSATGNKAADILRADWRNRDQLTFGGPGWFKVSEDLSGLIEPGATQIQVSIGIAQVGHVWYSAGYNATPAPYIDNIAILGLDRLAPLSMALAVDLPQDSFPRREFLDFQIMALNTIPFDIGRTPLFLKAGDPGDSTYIAIDTGDGPVLDGPPRVHYTMDANPIFDGDRTGGFPTTGIEPMDEVDGIGAKAATGQTFWKFDFPDSGFIFPGDRVHFYVVADDVDGGRTVLPADTTGFSVFPGDPNYDTFAYPLEMSFRGLPSLHSETPGDQPTVLIWFDTGAGGDAWGTSLANLGLVEGVDYDFYSTNAASAGLGNGISRTTPTQLDGYETIIYTSEHETVHLLATLEDGNPGDDVSVLRGWLELGDKNLVLFGDNVASELAGSATVGADFLSDWVGVIALGSDVRPEIDDQRTPEVVELPGPGLFDRVSGWKIDAVATSVMPDAITPHYSTVPLAEFLAPGSVGGAYGVTAATYHLKSGFNAEVLLFPFAFSSILDPDSGSKAPATLATRTLLLEDILDFLGHGSSGQPSEVPGRLHFSASSYPNPFNPRMEINFVMSATGPLTVEVFDIRGRLLKTLIDEVRPAGEGRVVWDGTDTDGRGVASGTYFWRALAGADRVVQKVSLVR